MLPFANMMHLFANKLSCLRAGRLSFTRVFLGTFDGFPFGHKTSSRQHGTHWNGEASAIFFNRSA